MAKNEKQDYIMILQVISSFGVICLHSNCFWIYSNSIKWVSANFVECLFYFAVPVFLMISGATLSTFSERYDLKTYYIKRARKVLIPYIAWSFIAIGYRVLFKSVSIKEISMGYLVSRLLKGDAISIYWFFPILFCLYLSIPVLSFLEKDNRKLILGYFVWGGLIVNIAVPFIINTFRIPAAWPLKIDVTAGYLLYPFAGAYFSNYELNKRNRRLLYIIAIAGFLTHFWGTHILSKEAGAIDQTFKGYVNLPAVMYSFGIFVFAKQCFDSGSVPARIKRYARFLSRYSFPCYLVHWFILDLMIKSEMFDTQAYWYRFVIPFFTYAVIVGFTRIIRKVPVLRHILP